MINYQQEGDSCTFTAPSGGVVGSTFYKIGQLLVCATADVAQGLPFVGKTMGVFMNAPKTTGEAWAEGAVLYWNNSTHKFTTTSSGMVKVGSAYAAAGSADTTGTVRLDGVANIDS